MQVCRYHRHEGSLVGMRRQRLQCKSKFMSSRHDVGSGGNDDDVAAGMRNDGRIQMHSVDAACGKQDLKTCVCQGRLCNQAVSTKYEYFALVLSAAFTLSQ